MIREEARSRYAELPVPDTREEPWRFTDLRGFDPDGNALMLHHRYAPRVTEG